ncbi:MAG: hypothetical protein ACK4K8_00360 [Pannonibacter sp.]
MVTIYNANGWKVDSYGNGLSYKLSLTQGDGETLDTFFQGDDATIFREEFDAADESDNAEAAFLNLFGAYAGILEAA